MENITLLFESAIKKGEIYSEILAWEIDFFKVSPHMCISFLILHNTVHIAINDFILKHGCIDCRSETN